MHVGDIITPQGLDTNPSSSCNIKNPFIYFRESLFVRKMKVKQEAGSIYAECPRA
jgi:hypothetical protein